MGKNISQRKCKINSSAAKQFSKFLLVGGICTGFDYLLYLTLYRLQIPMPIAKVISLSAAVLLNYVLNSSWTFACAKNIGQICKFIFVYSLSIGLNATVNELTYQGLAPSHFALHIAFVCAAASSALFSFFSLKIWVFRKKRKTP